MNDKEKLEAILTALEGPNWGKIDARVCCQIIDDIKKILNT